MKQTNVDVLVILYQQINNKKKKMNKLSKNELSELKGGNTNSSSDSGTVENKNSIKDCRCYYNNLPNVVINTNTADGCYCHCNVLWK